MKFSVQNRIEAMLRVVLAFTIWSEKYTSIIQINMQNYWYLHNRNGKIVGNLFGAILKITYVWFCFGNNKITAPKYSRRLEFNIVWSGKYIHQCGDVWYQFQFFRELCFDSFYNWIEMKWNEIPKYFCSEFVFLSQCIDWFDLIWDNLISCFSIW